MNQIFIGACIPFLVALIIYGVRRGRASLLLLIITPVCMAIGALVAHVPDLPRLFGNMDLYHKLAKDPRMDYFLWHHSIDLVEGDTPWYTLGVVLMAFCLIIAAWRELKQSERQ